MQDFGLRPGITIRIDILLRCVSLKKAKKPDVNQSVKFCIEGYQ